MSANAEALAWLEAHVAAVEPLHSAANLASWEAAVSGDDAALARASELRLRLRTLYSDAAGARRVRELLDGGVDDPLLRRQLVLADLSYRGNQLPPDVIAELTRREAGLEQTFYTFRAEFEGEASSNNLLLDVLREERDGARRRAAWEASKTVAREVAEPLRALVRARNDAARSLGYRDYYAMELELQEIDEAHLFALLHDFRARSEAPFARLRGEMDGALAARFGVAPGELRPWHWEDFFSQEAPALGSVALDPLFAGRDLVALAARTLEELALPVEDVLARSDLYERPGKDQHAFCTDIDRSGDVRVLANLRHNERSMATLLHELGHAAYDKFIPLRLPYLLRVAAHTLVTEASAMYLGRFTRNPGWLRVALGAVLSEAEADDVHDQQRTSLLVAMRWMLVMIHFERELYRDPDRHDLNALWWELVESFQLVRRPDGRDEPDWAAKIHLSLAPVYYHNYLLGELTASQFGACIRAGRAAVEGPSDRHVAGRFLREQVYERGATLPWNDLMRAATGEPLSARHFVADFV